MGQFSGKSSSGDEKERGTNDGEQWEEGGMRITVNSALDDRVKGEGYYVTLEDLETGAKSTAVYNEDGTLADVPRNRQFE